MKTDTSKFLNHVYTLAVYPPKGDRVVYWSRTPFGAFSVGDEISLATYDGTPRPETEVKAVVARIVREVYADTDEILDTTWLYLAPKI